MRAKPMTFGICVLACRPVSGSSCRAQRLEQGAMGEPLGERRGISVAREGEHVGQHLVHPAMFGGQHLLQLLSDSRADERSAPVREADQHLPCLARCPQWR